MSSASTSTPADDEFTVVKSRRQKKKDSREQTSSQIDVSAQVPENLQDPWVGYPVNTSNFEDSRVGPAIPRSVFTRESQRGCGCEFYHGFPHIGDLALFTSTDEDQSVCAGVIQDIDPFDNDDFDETKPDALVSDYQIIAARRCQKGVSDLRDCRQISNQTPLIYEYQLLATMMPFLATQMVKAITLREKLALCWSGLVFRRINKIVTNDAQFIGCEDVILTKGGLPAITQSKSKSPTVTDRSSRALRYKFYYGFTKPTTIRDNDSQPNKSLFFDSRDYHHPDFTAMQTGWFINTERRPHVHLSRFVGVGTLLCGTVFETSEKLVYDKWWHCSSQFMLLWTVVVRPELIGKHQTPDAIRQELVVPRLQDFGPLFNTSKSNLSIRRDQAKQIDYFTEPIPDRNFYVRIYDEIISGQTSSQEPGLSNLLWMVDEPALSPSSTSSNLPN